MGLLSSLFGKPEKTQFEIAGSVASFIEFIAGDAGVTVFSVRPITLHRDFHLALGGSSAVRGGDVLAVANISKLGGFSELSEVCEQLLTNHEMLRRMDPAGYERLRLMTLETLGSVHTDRISYGVIAEFRKQSPEFDRLKKGSPFG